MDSISFQADELDVARDKAANPLVVDEVFVKGIPCVARRG